MWDLEWVAGEYYFLTTLMVQEEIFLSTTLTSAILLVDRALVMLNTLQHGPVGMSDTPIGTLVIMPEFPFGIEGFAPSRAMFDSD